MSQVPNRPFYLEANLAGVEERLHELVRKVPHADEADLQLDDLRTLVYETVPELSQVGHKIALLLRQGVPTIVVQRLPFSCVGLESSKLVLLAFASCIGDPSAVDPYSRKRVWEVSPRAGPGPGYIPTITEHNYGADLHTDSSFKPTPERYVLFFAFHPAADGGGVSTLLTKDQLLARLSETDEGKECVRLLSETEFPFRVPTVFTKLKSETEMEWITAPIISDQPRVRFRHDLISSALELIPIKLSSEAEWALSYFVQILHECNPLSLALGQDDLLVFNNYVMLHGRTPFEDLDRTLLRVRLSTTH